MTPNPASRPLTDAPGDSTPGLKLASLRINGLLGSEHLLEIDIEADQEIAVQAGVTGTPTVQLFFNKELQQQWKGVKQRSEFRQAIEALLPVSV